MKVAFQKREDTILAGLIRWWTKSPYSHCEILFDDGLMFSAHPRNHGTRYIESGILNANEWDILMVPTTTVDDIIIRAFCNSQLGCRYDWWGIFFSQIIRLQREHPERWFCSEVCTSALQHIQRIMGARPCTFSPGKLFKRLKEAGATICVQ